MTKRSALAVFLAVLGLCLGLLGASVRAEPAINLGAEVQPSTYQGYTITDTPKAPCEGCLSLSGTIIGPATAVGFKAASSPFALAYDWLLNDPCQRDTQTWDIREGVGTPHEKVIARVPCPTPVYSGPFTVYLASWWFAPATWDFYTWAETPIPSCHPHPSTEEDGGVKVPRPAEPQACLTERCSHSQLVTLPTTVVVRCGGLVPRVTRHHNRRHRR